MRCFLLSFILAALSMSGCISTAADADECYSVESERCELRRRCDMDFDVEGCKYYYKEQCRARNIVPEYTEQQLNACLLEIRSYGQNDEQCDALRQTDKNLESELCANKFFKSCALIACEDVYADTETETSVDGDDDNTTGDDTVTIGLDP